MKAAPTPAQAEWMSLAYGMFIHFGPWTYCGNGDGQLPASAVDAPALDMRAWARLAAESGMRYAVLTAKHVDGFCLWPSRHTDYSVASTPQKRDWVGEFVDAFRAEGLRVGLYYGLLDRRCAFLEDDARYAAYVRDQVEELLTGYGELVELWFDGAWDKDHPSRDWPHDDEHGASWPRADGARWEWPRLYAHAHRLQPQCLVIQNSSSDRPGQPNYLPIDVRTAEQIDYIWREQLLVPPSDPIFGDVYLPLEYCTTLTPGWFWQKGASFAHASGETIASWRRRAVQQQANLLLNIGPDTAGRMPDYHRGFLVEAERLMRARS